MGMGSHHSCFLDFDFVEESNDINGTVGILCFGRNEYVTYFVIIRYTVCSLIHYFSSFSYGQLGYEDTTNRGPYPYYGYEDISYLSIVDLGSHFKIAQIQIMGLHNCILSTNDQLK